jgi:hypothetical protein
VSSKLVDRSPVDGWTGCLAGQCTLYSYMYVGKRVDKVSSRLVDRSPVNWWTGCLAGECT